MADDRVALDRAELERQKLIHELLADVLERLGAD